MWLFRLVVVGVLIMARGAPDDSNVKVGKDLYRLDDLAELAVRLGSIVNYNRYGSVLMLDGFEEGMNAWNKNTTGVAAEVVVSDAMAYNGQVSLKVDSGTGVTPYAGISKYLPPVTECRMGMQSTFNLNDDVESILFYMTYGKAPTRWYFIVRYEHATGELQYGSAPGVYTAFATPGALYDGSNNWHNLKMIVDLTTGEYVRCSLDNAVYDMSGFVPDTGAWAAGPFLLPILRVYGSLATEGIVYFDNVIVTYNEF